MPGWTGGLNKDGRCKRNSTFVVNAHVESEWAPQWPARNNHPVLAKKGPDAAPALGNPTGVPELNRKGPQEPCLGTTKKVPKLGS